MTAKVTGRTRRLNGRHARPPGPPPGRKPGHAPDEGGSGEPIKAAEPPPGTVSARRGFLDDIGILGWDRLEPVVLAALAIAEPMLLVGAHGTAKSMLLERLARTLGLEFRCYNASLLNYDDLVGIPTPDAERKSLRFITVPSAIWDAEVVFIDEISRTRPDLQNKLFPIIHERRVQGIELATLRHRWCAMNPPGNEDGGDYLGSEPLDPALADRFMFVVKVPGWDELTPDQQREILEGQGRAVPEGAQARLCALIAATADLYRQLVAAPHRLVSDYLVTLQSQLAGANVALSTRRMATLYRAVLGVHAARTALALHDHPAGGDNAAALPDWSGSALLALTNGLPFAAQGIALDPAAVLAAHRQAWEVASLDAADPWRAVLAVADPVDRLVLGIQLGPNVCDDDLSQLYLDAVASQSDRARRVTVALAGYLALRDQHDIAASAWEGVLADLRPIVVPGTRQLAVANSLVGVARKVGQICSTLADDTGHPDYYRDVYTRNLLESLIPDGYPSSGPDDVAGHFRDLWRRLDLDACVRPEQPQQQAGNEAAIGDDSPQELAS